MIIREFKKSDETEFLRLCGEFYSSDSTLKPFCINVAKTTFGRVMEKHENLWGYLFCDGETNEPIGYALVTSYWCNEEGGNVLVLDELYICPTSRHHGYGDKFLKWIEQKFKGKAVAITLEVLTTNQSAQSLYKKDGLVPDGFVTYTKSI
ncbi:MAG: GNAT family N-acetyltransferase [Candidatus Borkfalkiaceae bacterium]|nr:GNAT family N-acetyltransferase [Christensenellaceae bacterium]